MLSHLRPLKVVKPQQVLPKSNIEIGGKDNKDWQMSASEKTLLVGIVWITSIVYVCAMTVADPDLWGHTLYGLRAIEQSVLTERNDPFSYTAPGAAWVNHEWLTEYQFGWLWQHTGESGLWWWRNVMVVIVFAAAAVALKRSGGTVAAALALLFYSAQCLAGFCTFVRPQLATFALFAVSLLILRTYWDRMRGWAVWLLPVLSGIWVNQHGGFLAGVGIQGLFVVAFGARAMYHSRWWQRTFGNDSLGEITDASSTPPYTRSFLVISAVVVLSALATFVNPYGIGMYAMLWHHLGTEQAVKEWMPLWVAWQAPMYYVPFLLLVLAFAASRRWQWLDVWILAGVAYQAVSHIRHVALLCIAILILMAPALSESLSRIFSNIAGHLSGPHRRRRRLVAVCSACLLLLTLELPVAVGLWKGGIAPWRIAVESSRNAPGVPIRAVSVLQNEGITGHLVTEYSWGQYMLWHLYPDCRIAFDGRYRTVYPADVEQHYLDFQSLGANGPATTPILDDYDSEIVLLSALNEVCDYMAERDDWVRVYADEQAMIFVRKVAKFHHVIERAGSNGLTAPEVPNWTRFPGNPVLTRRDPGSRLVTIASNR